MLKNINSVIEIKDLQLDEAKPKSKPLSDLELIAQIDRLRKQIPSEANDTAKKFKEDQLARFEKVVARRAAVKEAKIQAVTASTKNMDTDFDNYDGWHDAGIELMWPEAKITREKTTKGQVSKAMVGDKLVGVWHHSGNSGYVMKEGVGDFAKVVVDGKKYDVVYIDDWNASDFTAAAEEVGISIDTLLFMTRPQFMKKLPHYIIRNFPKNGKQYRRYFTNSEFVKTHSLTHSLKEGVGDFGGGGYSAAEKAKNRADRLKEISLTKRNISKMSPTDQLKNHLADLNADLKKLKAEKKRETDAGNKSKTFHDQIFADILHVQMQIDDVEEKLKARSVKEGMDKSLIKFALDKSLMEASSLDKKVEIEGKVYDAIYIDEWSHTELRNAAEQLGVNIKGFLYHAQKQIVKDTLALYLVPNLKMDGKLHKRYFTTRAWVKSHEAKEAVTEALRMDIEVKITKGPHKGLIGYINKIMKTAGKVTGYEIQTEINGDTDWVDVGVDDVKPYGTGHAAVTEAKSQYVEDDTKAIAKLRKLLHPHVEGYQDSVRDALDDQGEDAAYDEMEDCFKDFMSKVKREAPEIAKQFKKSELEQWFNNEVNS